MFKSLLFCLCSTSPMIACVTFDADTNTYTVDTSGCVEFDREEVTNEELKPIEFNRD